MLWQHQRLVDFLLHQQISESCNSSLSHSQPTDWPSNNSHLPRLVSWFPCSPVQVPPHPQPMLGQTIRGYTGVFRLRPKHSMMPGLVKDPHMLRSHSNQASCRLRRTQETVVRVKTGAALPALMTAPAPRLDFVSTERRLNK